MGHFHTPPPPPIVSFTGAQPYAPNKLPPSILAVPVNNPPFIQAERRLQQQNVVAQWQPDPWQYGLELGAITGLQPYGSRQLNPSITAVPVNNPPFNQRDHRPGILQAWQPPDPPIQLPRYYPQAPAVVVAAVVPFNNAWLATVLFSWQPPDPLPTLPRNLNASITAVPVNNPPFNQTGIPTPGLAAWQPPDPSPFISYTGWQPLAPNKLSPGIPGQSVDNPPRFRFDATGILQAWQPPDPLPTLSGKQVQPFVAAPVQVIYQPYWLSGVLAAWQPPDPLPTLPRNLPAQITAVPVNNPPFSYVGRQAAITNDLVRSWQPPDPAPFNRGPFVTITVVVTPVRRTFSYITSSYIQ